MAESPPLSADEYARWLPTPAALQAVANALGDWGLGRQTIMQRVDGGLIRVCAKTIQWEYGNKSGNLPPYSLVPDEVIGAWRDSRPNNIFWVSGDDKMEVTRQGYSMSQPSVDYSMYGLRFDPEGIADIPGVVRSTPAPAPVSTHMHQVAKHGGGAPPKDYWEAVWVQIAADIIKGSFDPKKQADVEEAIQRIVIDLGKDIGSTSARKHAKLLWDKIK